jgi:rep14-4
MVKKFTQMNNDALKIHTRMIKSNPAAAALIMFLVGEMGEFDNVVSCSFKVLEKGTGFTRQALNSAINYLESIDWLRVYKNGRSNVYVINAEVAWKKHQDIRYRAKFRAKIILDSEEQTHDVTKSKQLVDLSELQKFYGLEE